MLLKKNKRAPKILICTSVTLDEGFQTLNIKCTPLEIHFICWEFFSHDFGFGTKTDWGQILVWHYLKAGKLISLCFWMFLSKWIQIKLKPYGQSRDMTPTFPPLLLFEISTGGKSGRSLCQRPFQPSFFGFVLLRIFCYIMAFSYQEKTFSD